MSTSAFVSSPTSSATKAGWVCLILGFLTFWIFGFGFVFFSVAIVCAVVAMCTNQLQRGLVLLLSSLFSLAICGVVFMLLVVGTVVGTAGVAVQKAQRDIQKKQLHSHP